MVDKPQFSDENAVLSEKIAEETQNMLLTAFATVGTERMIAQAMGMTMGIAHAMKTAGLGTVHRALRKVAAEYVKRK